MFGSSRSRNASRPPRGFLQYWILFSLCIYPCTSLLFFKSLKGWFAGENKATDTLSPAENLGINTAPGFSKARSRSAEMQRAKSIKEIPGHSNEKDIPIGRDGETSGLTHVTPLPTLDADVDISTRVSQTGLLTGSTAQEYRDPAFGLIPDDGLDLTRGQPQGVSISGIFEHKPLLEMVFFFFFFFLSLKINYPN